VLLVFTVKQLRTASRIILIGREGWPDEFGRFRFGHQLGQHAGDLVYNSFSLNWLCRDEEWKDNDGALNTISQLFPFLPTPHPNQRWEPDLFKDGRTAKPGIW
jgi:hypothetical protein